MVKTIPPLRVYTFMTRCLGALHRLLILYQQEFVGGEMFVNCEFQQTGRITKILGYKTSKSILFHWHIML